jgi:serine protease Do
MRTRLIRRKPVGAILALLALVAVVVLSASPASAQEAEDTPTASRVSDIVGPSIVYVQTEWEATFQVPFDDGTFQEYGPYALSSACTGFFVSNDGDIATAGHCVNFDIEIRAAFVEELFVDFEEEGITTSDELFETALEWDLDFSNQVFIFETIDDSGRVELDGTLAHVEESLEFEQGDLALLSISTDEVWPAVEIAPEDKPEVGLDVYSFGFPGAVGEIVDEAALTPSVEPGSVSSNQAEGAIDVIQVTSDISAGMSGGPAVNADGQVLGVNSHTPRDAEQAFVTNTEDLRRFLDGRGVEPELSAADKAYREGLDLFYAGEYNDAIKKFDVVLAEMPEHTHATDFRAEAVKNAPEPGSILPIILIGVGLVVIGAVALFLIRQRRQSSSTPPVITTEVPPPPTLPVAVDTPAGGLPPVVPLRPEDEPRGPGDICAVCGHGNPPGTRYCGDCGRPLTPSTSAG